MLSGATVVLLACTLACAWVEAGTIDEKRFGALIRGNDVDYFESSFEKLPTFARATASSKQLAASMLSLSQMDALIATNMSVYGNSYLEDSPPPLVYRLDLSLSKRAIGADGQPWAGIYNNTHWGTSSSVVTLKGVHEAFERGFSLIYNRVNYRWPPIAEMSKSFAKLFGCIVHANVYLTPSGSQGFEKHYDEMDVIIVQIAGSKQWLVYDPIVELPRVDQKRKPLPTEMTEPIFETELKEGDVLMLPRGYGHEARTASGSGPSLHVTFGIDVYDRTLEIFGHRLFAALMQNYTAWVPDVAVRTPAVAVTPSDLRLVCGALAAIAECRRSGGCEGVSEVRESLQATPLLAEFVRTVGHVGLSLAAKNSVALRKVLPVANHTAFPSLHNGGAQLESLTSDLVSTLAEAGWILPQSLLANFSALVSVEAERWIASLAASTAAGTPLARSHVGLRCPALPEPITLAALAEVASMEPALPKGQWELAVVTAYDFAHELVASATLPQATIVMEELLSELKATAVDVTTRAEAYLRTAMVFHSRFAALAENA